MARPTIRGLLIEDQRQDWVLCEHAASESASVSFDLTWEPDPDRSVQRAATDEFDVILLDYRLGAVNGIEVMEALRSRNVQTPIVFVTGEADPELERHVMRLGADDYLSKEELTARSLERAVTHAIERRRYVREIEAQKDEYRVMLASLHEGVLAFGANGVTSGANDRAARLLDQPRDRLVGTHDPFEGWQICDEIGAPLEHKALPWAKAIAWGTRATNVEIGLMEDGKVARWLSVNSVPLERREGRGAIVSMIDITSRRREHQTLERMAFEDPVTGLPNRLMLLDRMYQAHKLAERADPRFAVLFMDLDRFKAINDAYGHGAGDEVLRTVGRRVANTMRDHDTFARIAGDEFVALLLNLDDVTDAEVVAKRILDVVAEPVDIEGDRVAISTSIGIAFHPGYEVTVDEMLERADRAMFEAKRAGRNQVRIFKASN